MKILMMLTILSLTQEGVDQIEKTIVRQWDVEAQAQITRLKPELA